MAKDYFQDITPQGDDQPQSPLPPPAPAPRPQPMAPRPPMPPPPPMNAQGSSAAGPGDDEEASIPIRVTEPPRGIRSIPPPVRKQRFGQDMREVPGMPPPPPRAPRRGSRMWLWIIIVVALVVIGGFVFVALRPTLVTVTPKTHTVVFTNAMEFTAYPEAEAATGTLSYTVQTSDLDDSQVVPSSGGSTTTPAAKASGEITVVNDYSATSVKLIATTRFETPDGLIFRTPNNVVIPGKTSAGPGEVTVTVIADQAGSQYNVGPEARFTVPGLQSNSAMYANIYATSNSAMTGGSSAGTGPAVDPTALSAAVSALKQQLATKTLSAATAQAGTASTILPGLIQITYTSGPSTTTSGGVNVDEKAHVEVPVFPALALAQATAQYVSADAENQSLTLIPGQGFGAQLTASSTPSLGSDPLTFVLTGQAQLVWQVDTEALAQALAGKSSNSFQDIVATFPSIEEAQARIEPFWKSTFPSDPSGIHIQLAASSTSS